MKSNSTLTGLSLSLMVFVSFPVYAKSDSETIQQGKSIAQEKCAACHAIADEAASPVKTATPLRDFAKKWPVRHLEESMAEGLVTGHDGMPEFVFKPDEIEAFMQYLESLASPQTK